MKIERIVNDEIVFDNGNKIGYLFIQTARKKTTLILTRLKIWLGLITLMKI